MNNIFSKFNFKVGAVFGLSLLFVLAIGLELTPRSLNQAKAEQFSCSVVFDTAQFNPYPVNVDKAGGYPGQNNSDCTDFPVLSGNVTTSGSYAPSDFSAHAGDEIRMRIWMHNGAATNSGKALENVNESTVIDYNSGYITTTLTADGVESRTGSVHIQLDPGTHLEFVSGDKDTYFGEVQPCFEVAQQNQRYFVLRVVGAPVVEQQPASGSISGSVGGQVGGQCFLDGTVQWNTNNVSQAVVTVSDPAKNSNSYYDNDSIFSGSTNSTGSDAPWLSPNNNYRFTLWNVVPSGTSGSSNHTFQGQSYNVVELDETWLQAGSLNCGGNPTPTPTPTPNPTPTPVPGNESFTFTERPGTICVNESPIFTINATSGLANKEIYWSSTLDNGSGPRLTGEGGDFYGQKTDYSGYWSEPGFGYDSSKVGTWVKSVTMYAGPGLTNPILRQVTFTVLPSSDYRCGGTPTPTPTPTYNQVTCSVYPSVITAGQSATFTAANGNGTYSWTMNGQYQTSGQSFSQVFYNPGYFTVAVTSNGKTANCNLTVNPGTPTPTPTPYPTPTPTPSPSCPSLANSVIISPSTINEGGYATASAPYGWYNLNFTSTNSAIASVSGNSIRGVSAGIASINGTGSYNGANNCLLNPSPVYVQHVNQYSPVTCSVSPSIITAGQSATFSAGQGDGTYSWTMNGQQTSNSQYFTKTFSTQGNYTATVTSNGTQASCNVQVNPVINPVCTANSNFALNASTPVKSGSTYSVNISWSSTGSNSVKITEIAPGSSSETYFSTGSNTGNQTAYQLNPGSTYIFRMYDATCNTFLTSVSVTIPTNPSNLSCSADRSSVNILDNVTFTATGGSAPYAWVGGEIPNSGNGSSFNTKFSSSGVKSVTVSSTDGQSTQCSVVVNQAAQPGALTITKEVRNLGPSQTTDYSTSINAKKNDVVRYRITIRNSGQSTINNVVLTDSQAASASNMFAANDSNNIINTSGSLSSGLNLGSLAAGNSVMVTYTSNVTIDSGSILNTATVNGNGVPSQNAYATVNVTATVVPTSTGNCNNDSNSCNTNTNTNTSTNNNCTNCANQNNNSNINGNNNTVTQTNQNCVNNSCNSNVYITTGGTVVPAAQFAQISITKMVRNMNSGAYQNSVSANNGDSVQFEITVTNSSGNGNATNVRVTDNLPSGLSVVSGTVTVNGSLVSDNNLYNGMYLGNLSSGQSARIDFQARVNVGSGSSIQNNASATSDNAGSVQASAWVFVNTYQGCTVNCGSVQGSSVNLSYSKSAVNETKNANATTVVASREDFITYTLTVSNSGNAPANSFIITDDLSQVLPYADITDNGGGTVSGNTISFPGINVPAGGSVTRSFKVRVKYALADNLTYTMTNTYGNTVSIRINTPQVLGAFVAPKTGADTMGIVFAGMLTAAAAVFQKRKDILKLIFS